MKIFETSERVKIKGQLEPLFKGLTGRVGSYNYFGAWPNNGIFTDKQKKQFYYIVILDKPFVFEGGKWTAIPVLETDLVSLPKKKRRKQNETQS